jgi:hypothetical protein
VKRHSALAPAAALLAALALAPAASADTRYADDTGTGAAPCTAVGTPCSLTDALAQAQANDTVSIAVGTYSSPAGLSSAVAGVDIVGEPGGAKPVLQFPGLTGLSLTGANQKLRNVAVESPTVANAITTTAGATLSGIDVTAGGSCVVLNGAGSTIENSKLTLTGSPGPFGCLGGLGVDGATVRGVEVKSTSTGPGVFFSPLVLLVGSGMTIDRLTADTPAGPAVALLTTVGTRSVMRRSRISGGSATAIPVSVLNATGDVLVTDTLVQATGSGAPALPVTAVQATGGKLRNVTGIATGAGSQGLQVGGQATPSGVTSVKNSVFRGTASDVLVSPAGGGIICPPFCNPAGDLTINRSNFRTASGALNGASGDNQTSDPQFANAAGGDFRPVEGSPLIDAGVDDADNGTTDLDGNLRKQRTAIDIGAFELAPVPPPPSDTTETPQPTNPGGQAEPGPQPATPAPVADRTSPALSALGITNKTFAVGSAATPVDLARAKKGTTFVYTLSEPATTALTIERAGTGRRKGKSCVKATSRNRKAKKCALYTKAGVLTRVGANGPNAVPFSGRVGKKALKPATYRASLVAVDAAGNKSKPKTIGFKVVKK